MIVTRKQAIEWFEGIIDVHEIFPTDKDNTVEFYKMAVSALIEQESKREDGCWCCYLPVMKTRLIRELRQVLGVNPIYCPICGRKILGEKNDKQ